MGDVAAVPLPDRSPSRIVRLSLVLVSCATALACGESRDVARDYSGVVRFDTATIRVVTPGGSTRLHVEVAQSPEQRTMGLMERTSLPDSAGMLFLYDRDEPPT